MFFPLCGLPVAVTVSGVTFFFLQFLDAEKLRTPAVPEFSDQRCHTVSAGEAFGPALQHAPAGIPF